MIARVLVLAALFAGLFVWDRALIARDSTARTAKTQTVGRVLSPEGYAALDLAAIRLEYSDGRPAQTFVPLEGTWRCLEAYQAPADVAALEALIGAVTSAEGYVQTDDPAQAERYGIGTASTVRFSICGRDVLKDPTHDVQWSADLGAPRPGGDGSFLRPAGSSEVWAVVQSPRSIIDGATRPGVPPLVDATIVGKAWVARARGITRVFLDHADGSSFELASRPREVTEEELRAGIPPFEWVLDLSSKPLPLPMGRAMSYTFFLQRAEHVGVLDPRQAQALGYGGPNTSRLTLFAAEPPGAQAPPVEPLVLHFLPPLEDGSVPVVNPTSNAVYRVSAETASALLTTRKELFDKDAPNPWDAALKAMGYGGH